MKIVFKKHNKNPKLIVFITLFLFFIPALFSNNVGNQNEKLNDINNIKGLNLAQDTDSPIITFVQPEFNNTVIDLTIFTVIASIIDDNPPLIGNVTFQISNFTNFLFNATMDHDGLDQWSFTWDNISLYPNQFFTGYIIQIWAKDSSLNENLGQSDEYYIFLNLPGESPGLLNVILYLIAVSLIIAGVVVYLNKKLLAKPKSKKKEKVKGVFDD